MKVTEKLPGWYTPAGLLLLSIIVVLLIVIIYRI